MDRRIDNRCSPPVWWSAKAAAGAAGRVRMQAEDVDDRSSSREAAVVVVVLLLRRKAMRWGRLCWYLGVSEPDDVGGCCLECVSGGGGGGDIERLRLAATTTAWIRSNQAMLRCLPAIL